LFCGFFVVVVGVVYIG